MRIFCFLKATIYKKWGTSLLPPNLFDLFKSNSKRIKTALLWVQFIFSPSMMNTAFHFQRCCRAAVGMFYKPPPLQGNWFGMALNVADPLWRCGNWVDRVNGAKFSLWRAPRVPLWTLLVRRNQWKKSSESLNKSGGGECGIEIHFNDEGFEFYETSPINSPNMGLNLSNNINTWVFWSKLQDINK